MRDENRKSGSAWEFLLRGKTRYERKYGVECEKISRVMAGLFYVAMYLAFCGLPALALGLYGPALWMLVPSGAIFIAYFFGLRRRLSLVRE